MRLMYLGGLRTKLNHRFLLPEMTRFWSMEATHPTLRDTEPQRRTLLKWMQPSDAANLSK